MKLAISLPLLLAGMFVPAHSPEISAEAKQYLDQALDLIQKNSIRQKTDWASLRKHAYDQAADAKSPADTYPAIRDALTALGDHHSRLFSAAEFKTLSAGRLTNPGMECVGDIVVRVMPKGPAESAGLKAGMQIVSLNGQPYDPEKTPIRRMKEPFRLEAREGDQPTKSYTVTPAEHLAVRPPSGRLIDGRYGYLDVPTFAGTEPEQLAYAQRIQDLIRSFDIKGLRGWIVDLRLNGGGNMWPMIAGLGPLYPAGDLGAFVDAAGQIDKWTYREGKCYQGRVLLASTPHPYVLTHPGLPIAVLIDQVTASSGEATAISFRGLANATSLGQPTFGVPTGNAPLPLSDGAVLNLCEVIDADRTGKTYDTKIPPDLIVETNWIHFNHPDDLAIQAAIRWIKTRKKA